MSKTYQLDRLTVRLIPRENWADAETQVWWEVVEERPYSGLTAHGVVGDCDEKDVYGLGDDDFPTEDGLLLWIYQSGHSDLLSVRETKVAKLRDAQQRLQTATRRLTYFREHHATAVAFVPNAVAVAEKAVATAEEALKSQITLVESIGAEVATLQAGDTQTQLLTIFTN